MSLKTWSVDVWWSLKKIQTSTDSNLNYFCTGWMQTGEELKENIFKEK